MSFTYKSACNTKLQQVVPTTIPPSKLAISYTISIPIHQRPKLHRHRPVVMLSTMEIKFLRCETYFSLSVWFILWCSVSFFIKISIIVLETCNVRISGTCSHNIPSLLLVVNTSHLSAFFNSGLLYWSRTYWMLMGICLNYANMYIISKLVFSPLLPWYASIRMLQNSLCFTSILMYGVFGHCIFMFDSVACLPVTYCVFVWCRLLSLWLCLLIVFNVIVSPLIFIVCSSSKLRGFILFTEL